MYKIFDAIINTESRINLVPEERDPAVLAVNGEIDYSSRAETRPGFPLAGNGTERVQPDD